MSADSEVDGGIVLRAGNAADRPWIEALCRSAWGGPTVVSREHEHVVAELVAYIAERQGDRVGLLTLFVEGERCEVVTLNSLLPGRGVGQALMRAAAEHARRVGSRLLWLLTTNDNTAPCASIRCSA
jgi:N-acetylglutamate synthase-like GNAT family acetyltransferase